MKHLVKKANRYYIHWNIPKDVRHLFDGLAIYSRSLKTDNLGQAIMRRDQLLTELEGIVRKARVNPERQQFLALVKEIRKAAGEPPIEQDEENIEEAWSTELQVAIEKGDTVRADAIRAAMGWEDAEGIEAKYGITLMEAAKLYTETTEESLDPSTLSRLNLAPVSFASFLKLKDIHLADIDKRDVIAWVLECAKDKAPRTVKAYATCLSMVWDWAYRSKEVSGENPFKDLDIRLTSSGTKRTAFTVEQVAALLEDAGPAMYSLMKFALVTGCRLGELVTITAEDFHETDGVHYFTIKDGKTANAARNVPLPVSLWEELKAVVESELWTRTETRTRPSSAQYWSVMFQKHKDAVLGEQCSAVFHSFRKMAATGYQRAQVFEGIAAGILGHSRKGLTLSYGLYATGFELQQQLEAVEKMLAGEYMQSFLNLFNK